jgi:hypothetical protein
MADYVQQTIDGSNREINDARTCGITERDWLDGRDARELIWFIWSVWFKQTNETDQINKRNQPVLALHAQRSVALANFF